jgi:hypothetical protein
MQIVHKYFNCIIIKYVFLSVSARNIHLQTDLHTKEFWLSIRKTHNLKNLHSTTEI